MLSPTLFTLHILLSTIAAGGAYGLLLSTHQRQLLTSWLSTELLLTFLAAAGSAIVSISLLLNGTASVATASYFVLLLSLANVLAIACLFLKGRNSGMEFVQKSLQTLSIIAFSLLLIHWFLLVFSLIY